MNLQKQSYFSVSSSRAPIRNTADYSPFGIQLDGRTIFYAPPAPAPPSVTVVYQHKFDDNPSTHPYTTAPNQLNTKLTNVSWTNSQSSWTNFAGFTGKAIATNSATPDTTRLYLNLTVNSGFMLDVKSYSFYHRSSTTGYTNYQLLVNGIFVGSGSIFVSSGSTLQSTGTINVANAVAGLTGSVTVTLKLFGGSNGNNATFRLDDFTLNGYTQEVQVYAENYRRGFNGMEKDDEVKGGGNSYDFGSRIYDSRVARFLSLDPRLNDFPFMSPYCFAANNPIRNVDINGEGPGDRIKAALKFLGTPYKQEYEYEGKTRTYLRTGSDEKGLEKMDCSELVCRVLAADMLTNGVKSMATTNLIKYFDDNADTWEKSETPQSGDVLLWNGHTGIVESYDAENKKVFVIHATSYISNKKNVHSVVQESYSLSYYEKKGAFFYRPKKEQDNNIYESKKEIGEISIKGNSGNLPKLKTNTISNISSKNGEVKINENDDKTEKK